MKPKYAILILVVIFLIFMSGGFIYFKFYLPDSQKTNLPLVKNENKTEAETPETIDSIEFSENDTEQGDLREIADISADIIIENLSEEEKKVEEEKRLEIIAELKNISQFEESDAPKDPIIEAQEEEARRKKIEELRAITNPNNNLSD